MRYVNKLNLSKHHATYLLNVWNGSKKHVIFKRSKTKERTLVI
jgi:hypothetical protein